MHATKDLSHIWWGSILLLAPFLQTQGVQIKTLCIYDNSCSATTFMSAAVIPFEGLTGKHFEVLHEEGGRHHEPRAGDEQRQEEIPDILELVQSMLLLVGRAQHDACHKGPQLRRKAL